MSDRHVVVVGGAGGIGRAIAERFAREGCTVHLLGRDPAKVHHVCDLGRPESIAAAFAALPRIDVMVNAAGSIPRKSLHETKPEDWRGAWTDKVLGMVETCRLASERMRQSGGGVIVNVIGTAGVKLNSKSIMTTTANASLIAFTQALGAQSVDWNVRVVGINPGLTATPRTEDLANGKGGDSYEKLLADLPMQRMASAAEIADCAWFLASDQARYISGTVIDIDGGARWRS